MKLIYAILFSIEVNAFWCNTDILFEDIYVVVTSMDRSATVNHDHL